MDDERRPAPARPALTLWGEADFLRELKWSEMEGGSLSQRGSRNRCDLDRDLLPGSGTSGRGEVRSSGSARGAIVLDFLAERVGSGPEKGKFTKIS